MSIRKGDVVMVIAGKEKGKTGKVFRIDRPEQRVWVEKLNMVKRHQRPTGKQRQGGIVEKEASLHISNVMYYDEKSAKPTRLGMKVLNKEGKKIRVARKSGEAVDAK